MRFFYLLNTQHIILYVLPTLIGVILFGMMLGYQHFRASDSEARLKTVAHRYPEGIEGRNAPFPLGLALLCLGTVLWMLGYVLFIGISGRPF